MRSLMFFGFILLLSGGVLGGGWYYWTAGRFFETTNDAYVHSDISVVSAQSAGVVRAIHAVDNQAVRRGDLLITLIDTDYAARVAQAQAAVVAQRATIAKIQREIEAQRAIIEEGVANEARTLAEVQRTRLDHDRYLGLAAASWASHQRLEQAEADWRKASATAAQAQAETTARRSQIRVLDSASIQAETVARHLQTAVTLAEIELDHTVIRAPIDGVVSNRAAQIGQYVRGGAPLLSLVPLPMVYVVANFKETQIAQMRPGQTVSISVDAFPGQTLQGRIDGIAPGSGSVFSLLPPENATGNFTKIVQRVPVRIALPQGLPDTPDEQTQILRRLRPGLSVSVSIDTRQPGATDATVLNALPLASAP